MGLRHIFAKMKVAQVIFFPSRPGHRDPAVTRRIMDYMLFMNSKVLFKVVSPSVHTTPCTRAGHLPNSLYTWSPGLGVLNA